jgi:iron complex transport system ATP-binding protein
MNLEARNISVNIRDKAIVRDASLSINGGELVGLIGPNGAGKSTLLKAMLGIRPRDGGAVIMDGQDFLALPGRERARRVAFLPQERHVEWRLPGRDVVMLGRYPHHSGFGGYSAEDEAAVDRAISSVDGHALMDKPVTVLSGGERTLVLLARALAVESPILLTDEPIAALDPYHQLHVMEILRGLARRGSGVLAVIHDLSLAARFMDRLVLMNAGHVVASGKPAEVLTPELLARVYRIDGVNGARLPDR